ncbi:hypothetical protein Rt10032_c04g2089 [Rhodotorula toruloides]|uniref:Uncharacterized protein n=1 Tax=Rhodotorula toruloides TaxID=5286 RepID=A0A511KCM3_RHOTO|nr:hypothetical protein Rt10032_c04g2089 [Rhodotorula toruloides]
MERLFVQHHERHLPEGVHVHDFYTVDETNTLVNVLDTMVQDPDEKQSISWKIWIVVALCCLAQPPEQCAPDVRNETLDALTKNSGPALRQAAMRLMRHTLCRDAHGPDEHYAPVLFAAGAARDQDEKITSPATVWELGQMFNIHCTSENGTEGTER